MTVQRLHHHAYVCRDQEETRRFYEDVIGLPLVATWAEEDKGVGGDPRPFVHTFFGLPDGSALAFFQFADAEQNASFAPPSGNPYVHVALAVDAETQAAIASRLEASGQTPLVIDHGYCTSLYASDPNGLLLEFTLDPPDAGTINESKRATARDDLDRWMAGDHTPNNDLRSH